MAYSKFTIKTLKELFNIKIIEKDFLEEKNVKPSDFLLKYLDYGFSLKPRSEKAKSELIIAPILLELRAINNNNFFIYSGENLDVDSERKLNGECDFILTKDGNSLGIQTPIFAIIEAKRDAIASGDIAQAIAQMIGSKIFNEQENNDFDIIFGAVTTGQIWQFLKLQTLIDDKSDSSEVTYVITLEETSYYINNLEKILGALQQMVDYYK